MLSRLWSGVVNSTVATLMPEVLPYFWKFEIPDEVIELAFCDLMIGGVCAWQVLCISWSWWLLFFVVSRNTVFVVRVRSKSCTELQEQDVHHHEAQAELLMVYSDTQVLIFFLHGQTVLNRGHHTEITVSALIARHLPNHGHSKRHTTPFSIHLRIEFGWRRSAAHMWCPFFLSWSPTLKPKCKKYAFFCWSNRTLPWGKCHFSTNIAEVIRVIYALLGHFDKYTTQYMTVECQLKLSQHNSLERTWGHQLQYDCFRITLNKNWRELTGNNFIDHVTNACSDDSRSRDFIVVWELRRTLRVLPSFEDGDLIFSWKKWNFMP